MSNLYWARLVRRASLFGVAALVATGVAIAQSAPTAAPSNAQSFSQSSITSAGPSWSDSNSSAGQVAELAAPRSMPALPSAPAPSASAAGGAGSGGGLMHSLAKNFAFEVGGGVNAPESSSVTWGGNFTIGGGANFSKNLALLLEYQFIDDKLPGALIAETGASGGHAHIWSLTLDPVLDLFPKASNDIYATGGGGFYRKVTSFTDIEPEEFCSYFYCGVGYVPQTVGHFSSNQGGYSIGGGYIHRMGGIYGTSKMKLFAEVRYLDVLSPALTTQPNGLGSATVGADTKLVPVTFGIRW
ncbi:MAG: hypothetical protein ACRD3N_01350 [Terracidiphilus sp.]